MGIEKKPCAGCGRIRAIGASKKRCKACRKSTPSAQETTYVPFNKRLSDLGFSTYNDYLAGEHWQNFRTHYRESTFPQFCIVCGRTDYSLHHVTYDRLGRELLTDVLPLCQPHHEELHEVLRERGLPLSDSQNVVMMLSGTYSPEKFAEKMNNHRKGLSRKGRIKERARQKQTANKVECRRAVAVLLSLSERPWASHRKDLFTGLDSLLRNGSLRELRKRLTAAADVDVLYRGLQ